MAGENFTTEMQRVITATVSAVMAAAKTSDSDRERTRAVETSLNNLSSALATLATSISSAANQIHKDAQQKVEQVVSEFALGGKPLSPGEIAATSAMFEQQVYAQKQAIMSAREIAGTPQDVFGGIGGTLVSGFQAATGLDVTSPIIQIQNEMVKTQYERDRDFAAKRGRQQIYFESDIDQDAATLSDTYTKFNRQIERGTKYHSTLGR